MTSSHVRRLQSRVARTATRFVDHATKHRLDASALPAVRLPWFEVRDASEPMTTEPGSGGAGTAEVLIFDEIGGSFGVDASALVEELAALTADTIRVRINSPGGSVFDAIAIYNALNHHDARIEVYVDALAASAASIIAMAGDEVVMMPGSQMMIHDASTVVDGNAADVAKLALFLDRQSNNLADLYRQRAGGTVAQWRALMLAETWLFADEAVAAKLADRAERAPKAQPDKRMARAFDLSAYRYEGRAQAPAPEFRDSADGAMSALSPSLEARTATLTGRPAQQSGRRFGTLSRVEVRTNDDGSVHVEGHAAVFDSTTQIGAGPAGFEERIAPGAFTKTIRDNADVRFLFNHNPDLVLARTKSGTLSLREDARGLAVSADLAPTSVGRDLAILLARGDVSQMSFGFQAIKDAWTTETRDDGSRYELRTVLEARLFDVSAVTYPAYDDTDIAAREAQLARELRSAPGSKSLRQPPPDTAASPVSPAPSGAHASPEPAVATPGTEQTDERSLPLADLLLRHARGVHVAAPRALCPACTSREPAPATPA